MLDIWVFIQATQPQNHIHVDIFTHTPTHIFPCLAKGIQIWICIVSQEPVPNALSKQSCVHIGEVRFFSLSTLVTWWVMWQGGINIRANTKPIGRISLTVSMRKWTTGWWWEGLTPYGSNCTYDHMPNRNHIRVIKCVNLSTQSDQHMGYLGPNYMKLGDTFIYMVV